MKKNLAALLIFSATFTTGAIAFQHKGALESHDAWLPKRNKVVQEMINESVNAAASSTHHIINIEIVALNKEIKKLQSQLGQQRQKTNQARSQQGESVWEGLATGMGFLLGIVNLGLFIALVIRTRKVEKVQGELVVFKEAVKLTGGLRDGQA